MLFRTMITWDKREYISHKPILSHFILLALHKWQLTHFCSFCILSIILICNTIDWYHQSFPQKALSLRKVFFVVYTYQLFQRSNQFSIQPLSIYYLKTCSWSVPQNWVWELDIFTMLWNYLLCSLSLSYTNNFKIFKALKEKLMPFVLDLHS